MKKLNFFLLLSLLVVMIGITTYLPVSSQSTNNDVGLSLRPAIIELPGIPDQNQQSQVVIKNITDHPLPISAEITSLIPVESELDQSRRAEFDASSWITLEKTNFVLAPEQETLVNFSINVPQQANPGGHYAQIGFRVLSSSNESRQNGSQIIPEVSAMLFITVPGDVNEQAELDTSMLVSGYIVKGSKQQLSFTIKNPGNVHILPAPIVTINSKNGEIRQINMQPQLVLPNTQKTFTVEWQADVGIGRYDARVETLYGSENVPLANQPSSFMVIPPWWQIFVAILTICTIVGILVKRQNIPNFLKVLSGKKIHIVGKKRYSKELSSKSEAKMPESVGDYASINDFLGETRSVSPLSKPQIMSNRGPSAEFVQSRPTNNSEVIKEAIEKETKEPISVVPVKPKVTVSEYETPENKNDKVIIVQTSASTIIRQEPTAKVDNDHQSQTSIKSDPANKTIKVTITEEPKNTPTKKSQKVAEHKRRAKN